MAELLKGKAVAASLNEATRQTFQSLKDKGITVTLAVVRVGNREDDLSYEKGIIRRCEETGVEVNRYILPEDVGIDEFYGLLDRLNKDPDIHGILMFRPLPKHLGNEKARNSIAPQKDVDGCTDASLAGVFTNKPTGFSPCTAEAAMEILKYYHIELAGRNVVVLGRSLVVGRPLAMLLMHENATVTICHTGTLNTPEITRNSDIIISCIGHAENITAEYVKPGQTVIDVGITYSETKHKICGDCLFEEVEPIVDKITPVPGGVGSVTTAVLIHHVALAAERHGN